MHEDIILVPNTVRFEFLRNGWVIPEGAKGLVIHEMAGGEPNPEVYKAYIWYPMMRRV